MATDQELDAIEGKLLAQIEGLRHRQLLTQAEASEAPALRNRLREFERMWIIANETMQALQDDLNRSLENAGNWQSLAEQAEAARDELRAALDRAFSDRDYWLEWKKAVPVDAISLLQRNFRPGSLNELQAAADIAHWLVKLDADEAQP
jgi:hypothetical protein